MPVENTRFRLAYLTSQYPATSHTFISREVAALRELGVDLETFTIRPPSEEEMKDEAIRRESKLTLAILRQAPWSFLSAQLALLFSAPASYFRTLRRALGHRPPGMSGFARAFVYFAEAVLLARELKRRRITRLHNHFANAGAIVGYLAAGLANLPWSFTMHGISETDYPAGLLLRKKIEAADFVVCVSYFGQAQAMRLAEMDQWAKLHVVRCGLPLDTLPQREEVIGAKRIICVGRLSAEKGQGGLLQAFASLGAAREDCEIVFVGDGPEVAKLKDRVVALGMADRVLFMGRLGEQETLEQISASDMLVLPSFMEGLPIVLMEAMALGTPVIASRVAGIPELVEDGVSGLLFTPSDWDDLGRCISRLLAEPALARRFATTARAVVAARFDIRHSAAQMRRLFVGKASS